MQLATVCMLMYGPVCSVCTHQPKAFWVWNAVHCEPDSESGRSQGTRFFFLLRTALKDRPKGPPTANRQLPSTANRHQPSTTNRHQPPPTASGDQPPTANHHRPPPTTNHQPPTATNHHQTPPTASSQLPTANRRQPPTANRHQLWLSTWSARGLFWENWFRNTFFFPLRTALEPVVAHSSRAVQTICGTCAIVHDRRTASEIRLSPANQACTSCFEKTTGVCCIQGNTFLYVLSGTVRFFAISGCSCAGYGSLACNWLRCACQRMGQSTASAPTNQRPFGCGTLCTVSQWWYTVHVQTICGTPAARSPTPDQTVIGCLPLSSPRPSAGSTWASMVHHSGGSQEMAMSR